MFNKKVINVLINNLTNFEDFFPYKLNINLKYKGK